MKALILDTETTGLISNRTIRSNKQPHIIEFYGCIVDLETGQKTGQDLDLLIKPPVEISAEITKITTITNDLVKDAPSFADVASDIKSLIESAPLAIAHNMAFDRDMVDIEMDRLNLTVAWPTLLCTTEQTVHLKGFRLKLSMLHEHLIGAPFSGAHRAKVDVEALVRCCVKLHEMGEI